MAMEMLLAAVLAGAPAAARSVRIVPREQILEAMKASQGYDPSATSNGPRFQAETLLRIARQERARHPEGPPLLLGHAEWFEAFLERTGLTAEEAPTYVRLAYEHHQDTEMDYRRDRVIEAAEGRAPDLALNVRLFWPDRPGAPRQYSYEDVLASPRLKVTNERVITYRLLDYGDLIVYAEIEGLRGRPTTGVLGFLFRLIGEGHVKESRMAISPDGLQVSRARAEKAFFGVTQTVTVHPDGRIEKDVPADRPDLQALEARLKEPLRLRYRRLEPPGGR